MSKLGQLLVGHGWLTVQQLTRALQAQSAFGSRLGTCLLEMDVLTEDNLLKGLAEQHGVPSASIDDLRGIPDEVLALIPDKLARRCRAVPFRVVGSRLDVAMMDPRNLAAQDELAFASSKRVMVCVAHELRILEALERYYGEESPARLGRLLERLNRARYFWEREKPAEAGPPTSGLASLPTLAAQPSRLTVRRSAAPQPAPSPPSPAPQSAAAAPVSALATAPPPPRPVKQPTMQTVSMTEDERAALITPPPPAGPQAVPAIAEAAPAATPSSLPSLISMDEVESAFARTHEREEVARIALGYLARSYRRAALFQVTKEKVSAWMAQGDLDLPIFQKFSTSFDQPSLFLNLRQGSSLYMGTMPPMPAHRELARAWGGELPKDCVLLPVRLRDRLVAVLYADGGLKAAKGLGGIDLPQLQRLALSTGAALERGILHRKRAEANP